jgi:hypothetical protein
MKSFLQGKKILKAEQLRAPGLNGLAAATAATKPAHTPLSVVTPGASSAHVEVVKEGDKVIRLVVTCVCGERVEIECLYSAGS